MAKIFITGSADGLGKLAAQLLVAEKHEVYLHARNDERVKDALSSVPGAAGAVSGDLASIKQTKHVAEQVNAIGHFDAVIHNAAVGYKEPKRIKTEDGLPHVFAINSLAPYILTCLISKPARLIYISSGLHNSGDVSLNDLEWIQRKWSSINAYSDTKLHNLLLAFTVARKWKDVLSNAIEPGWVATKMGGAGAPDSLKEAPETQAWLAVSNDKEALVSGKYFYHKKLKQYADAADNIQLQDKLLNEYERISGIKFPV